MGVKGLWSVLEPVLEPVSLADMQGQRVAIDLSIWIYENLKAFCQHKGKAALLQKRSMFYRILHMLQWGIRPVFVLEGKSPLLKAGVLERRRAAGSQEESQLQTDLGNTDHVGAYARLLSEWKEMFEAMNVPYVISSGEGEAMCAQLNAAGLVDGCITCDGDAFLFGAKVLYKNFTADPHKPDQMKRCNLADIESRLKLTREHLVTLALLSGCDYTDGVKGVGPDACVKLFNEVGPSVDILERLRQWRGNEELDLISTYKFQAKPTHCGRCGHEGNKRSHDSEGCRLCQSRDACVEQSTRPCSCDYHHKASVYKSRCNECSIRAKALDSDNFPNQEIIEAFLKPQIVVPDKEFTWQLPDISELKKFLRKKFNWSAEETLENILPLYTGFDMVMSLQASEPCKGVPLKIFKKKMKHFSAVFEVQWRYVNGIDDDIEHLVTHEDAKLFNDCYPEIVCAYDVMVERKKSARGKKRKPENEVSQIKINQFYKVRKKLSFTPVKAGEKASSSKDKDSSSNSEDAGCSHEFLADPLLQTPPRKSPRLSPGKKRSFTPSPSRLAKSSTLVSRRAFLPKKLHFSRESTPDKSVDPKNGSNTQGPVCSSTPVDDEELPDLLPQPSSDPTQTPAHQDSTVFLNKKGAWLRTLSPMHHSDEDDAESKANSSGLSGSTIQDAIIREDYNKVKESLVMINLTDSEPQPTNKAQNGSTATTPSTVLKSTSKTPATKLKSTGRSRSKSAGRSSRKLKSPEKSQMRMDKFVKRRLLQS